MMKKIFFSVFVVVFVLSPTSLVKQTQASTDYTGKLVRMNGLTSLYYVAADGKRYVFPNENIYKSWFPDFDEVLTLSDTEIFNLPLGGNVLYRPGILLVKITTDPKVYAVTKGGTLRWVKSEGIAKALYGEKWGKLVDDVPDSFFTNYNVGNPIDDSSEYNPDNEAEDTDSIDSNHGLSTAKAKKARTKKCNIVSNSRHCRADSDTSDKSTNSDDKNNPRLTGINISNNGIQGRIDGQDEIVITFSESVNPASINSNLVAGGVYSSFDFDKNGSIDVSDSGLVTIKNIASFDMGTVQSSGKFGVKLSLSPSAKILTITLLAGDEIRINEEKFTDAKQLGGTIKDSTGNEMESDDDIGKPTGTFGGRSVNDGIEPYISSISAYNGGLNDRLDVKDEIRITFSEKIDPKSINSNLTKGGSVNAISKDKTGGVKITSNGVLTVKNIASFYVGDANDGGEFTVSLSLDLEGKKLTIKITSGSVELSSEDLDDAQQIGGTIEDLDGNEMENDPNISDPTGSFIKASAGGDDPYISYIKAFNYGYAGYLDKNDKIAITFSTELDPETINNSLKAGSNVGGIDTNDTGGVYINANGLLTITDILSFDIGDVEKSGDFVTDLALSANGKVLTITLTDGDSIEINSENFSAGKQIGGTVEDISQNVMDERSSIDKPLGTFGGDSLDTPPYITGIEIKNNNDTNYVDAHDLITVTFNESIDPRSINSILKLGSYVKDVDDDDTGGVIINDDGVLTISDIAEFSIGNVKNESEFKVKLSLNSIGNILTIDLTSGTAVEINYEDFDEAKQTGGTIKDKESNEMENDPRINDPSGSF
jgi:hypothetical protein